MAAHSFTHSQSLSVVVAVRRRHRSFVRSSMFVVVRCRSFVQIHSFIRSVLLPCCRRSVGGDGGNGDGRGGGGGGGGGTLVMDGLVGDCFLLSPLSSLVVGRWWRWWRWLISFNLL